MQPGRGPVLYGRFAGLARSDLTSRCLRIGIDLQWNLGFLSIRGELSANSDEGADVSTALLEMAAGNATDTLSDHLQLVNRRVGNAPGLASARSSNASLGMLFTPDRRWSLSAAFA